MKKILIFQRTAIVFAALAVASAALFTLPRNATALTSALTKPPNNLGLVGYWPMNEGTSTQAGDFSGNRNTGTFGTSGASNPAWTTGKRGSALNFTGTTGVSGSYVDMGDVNAMDGLTAVTVSAWIKSSSPGANSGFGGIVGKSQCSGGGGDGPIEFFVDNATKAQFVIYQAGGSVSSGASTSNVDDANWHFVVGKYDGANVSIWVDGVQQNQNPTTGSMTSTSNILYIGNGCTGALTAPYLGKLDDVRIYSRSLSTAEIVALYAGGTAGAAQIGASSQTLQNGTSLSRGLVGLWTFDGYDLTDKVYDRSGQGNNGYLSGGMPTSTAKVQGKLGQALTFDNTNDTVKTPSPYPGTVRYTMSAWVKVNNIAAGVTDVAVAVNDNWMGIWSTNKWACNPSSLLESNQSISSGWHLLTCTFDSTLGSLNLKLYLDGVLDNTLNTSSFDTTTGNLCIGAYGPTCTDFSFAWNGQIDDVRVYNRELTVAEVKQLYNLGQTQLRP